jgi:hypothetical protein
MKPFCVTPLNLVQLALGAALVADLLPSQRFASYDADLATSEFATSNCLPGPPAPWTADLVTRTPSANPAFGAVAADNRNQLLYICTGRWIDGIDRIQFDQIGARVPALHVQTPPMLNQITGMCVNPLDPSGNRLFVTDGYLLVDYDVTAGAAAIVISMPTGGVTMFTGLDYDPFSGKVLAVDMLSHVHALDLASLAWMPLLIPAPGVPVPTGAIPTGIAADRSAARNPLVSYSNGDVLDLVSGASQLFAPSPSGGPRHHRGLTCIGLPRRLPGAAPSMPAPKLTWRGSLLAGTPACAIEVDSMFQNVLAVDVGVPLLPGVTGIPVVSGTLFVNAGAAALFFLPPGVNQVNFSFLGIPAGLHVTHQGFSIAGGQFQTAGAAWLTTMAW